MKTCSKCGIPKQLSEYHKDSRLKSGYRPDCKECRKPITKAYTPTAVVKMKERYATDPDYKAKAKANAKKFYKVDVVEITEMYAVRSLKRGTDLSRADLRQFPELIQAKQAQLKLERLIRNAKRKENKCRGCAGCPSSAIQQIRKRHSRFRTGKGNERHSPEYYADR